MQPPAHLIQRLTVSRSSVSVAGSFCGGPASKCLLLRGMLSEGNASQRSTRCTDPLRRTPSPRWQINQS